MIERVQSDEPKEMPTVGVVRLTNHLQRAQIFEEDQCYAEYDDDQKSKAWFGCVMGVGLLVVFIGAILIATGSVASFYLLIIGAEVAGFSVVCFCCGTVDTGGNTCTECQDCDLGDLPCPQLSEEEEAEEKRRAEANGSEVDDDVDDDDSSSSGSMSVVEDDKTAALRQLWTALNADGSSEVLGANVTQLKIWAKTAGFKDADASATGQTQHAFS